MRNQDYSILIRELKAGKESAFDSLFRLFYQDLCRFACSFLNDPMMAEDVVQGIFEKIWTPSSWQIILMNIPVCFQRYSINNKML